jgi:hypothetical protein
MAGHSMTCLDQNWWNTTKVDRVGVPTIKMSDGPVSNLSLSK